MADRWMDERDRRYRDRDWRRSEDMNRGGRFEGGEERSFIEPDDDYGSQRDRVFGERESGATYGGQDYRAGGRYGEGRSGGGYGERGGRGGERGGWQSRDYGGVSPAMEQNEYDAERYAERYDREHPIRGGYGGRGGGSRQGGRYYGDAGRERIYREEYGQGGREYGEVPRGYDAGYGQGRGYGASGGTGGYDYERGYGEGGRRSSGGGYGRDYGREDRGERFERGGREAGEFLRRAGERVASWFGVGEGRGEDFRGMGPKGYKRADDRISDEIHERLTDDPWLDATNVSVSVSGGEVTLSGTVENREAKHRAERIVEDVSGVAHVQNNLRVDHGNPLTHPGPGYGDSVLGAQIREAEVNDGAGGATNGSSRSSGSTSTDTGKSR